MLKNIDTVEIIKENINSNQITLKIETINQLNIKETIFDMVVSKNWKLLEMYSKNIDLDDVFRALTLNNKMEAYNNEPKTTF